MSPITTGDIPLSTEGLRTSVLMPVIVILRFFDGLGFGDEEFLIFLSLGFVMFTLTPYVFCHVPSRNCHDLLLSTKHTCNRSLFAFALPSSTTLPLPLLGCWCYLCYPHRSLGLRFASYPCTHKHAHHPSFSVHSLIFFLTSTFRQLGHFLFMMLSSHYSLRCPCVIAPGVSAGTPRSLLLPPSSTHHIVESDAVRLPSFVPRRIFHVPFGSSIFLSTASSTSMCRVRFVSFVHSFSFAPTNLYFYAIQCGSDPTSGCRLVGVEFPTLPDMVSLRP